MRYSSLFCPAAVLALIGASHAQYALSPTSLIKGKKFDRFVNIFLENADYDVAAADPNLSFLSTLGITLTDYHAISHPSQPNYVAAVGGSTNGVWLDTRWRIDKSVQTIVDLLEAKGISWSEYQEDMPYSGFQDDFNNPQTGASDYVRKHNPLISYDSITSVPERLANIKNLTLFYEDLDADTLPQWMFISPNMTNDGHDSSVTVAGAWARTFLKPLLSNPNFMRNTLVLLTFDESGSYFSDNKVYSLLLGDAVPVSARGTSDGSRYDHYSIMATVERNWDLGTLGKNDAGAAVFF